MNLLSKTLSLSSFNIINFYFLVTKFILSFFLSNVCRYEHTILNSIKILNIYCTYLMEYEVGYKPVSSTELVDFRL